MLISQSAVPMFSSCTFKILGLILKFFFQLKIDFCTCVFVYVCALVCACTCRNIHRDPALSFYIWTFSLLCNIWWKSCLFLKVCFTSWSEIRWLYVCEFVLGSFFFCSIIRHVNFAYPRQCFAFWYYSCIVNLRWDIVVFPAFVFVLKVALTI